MLIDAHLDEVVANFNNSVTVVPDDIQSESFGIRKTLIDKIDDKSRFFLTVPIDMEEYADSRAARRSWFVRAVYNFTKPYEKLHAAAMNHYKILPTADSFAQYLIKTGCNHLVGNLQDNEGDYAELLGYEGQIMFTYLLDKYFPRWDDVLEYKEFTDKVVGVELEYSERANVALLDLEAFIRLANSLNFAMTDKDKPRTYFIINASKGGSDFYSKWVDLFFNSDDFVSPDIGGMGYHIVASEQMAKLVSESRANENFIGNQVRTYSQRVTVVEQPQDGEVVFELENPLKIEKGAFADILERKNNFWIGSNSSYGIRLKGVAENHAVLKFPSYQGIVIMPMDGEVKLGEATLGNKVEYSIQENDVLTIGDYSLQFNRVYNAAQTIGSMFEKILPSK